MSENDFYTLVICHVSVAFDENLIKQELMQTYKSVLAVRRVFGEDRNGEEIIFDQIEVDLTSDDETREILQNRSVFLGGTHRSVYRAKDSKFIHIKPKNVTTNKNDWRETSFTEKDLINRFEEQKRTLSRLMASIEVRLNQVIASQ